MLIFKKYWFSRIIMAISQLRSKRKKTGGRYKYIVKKVKNKGNKPLLVTVNELSRKTDNIRAGRVKYRLLSTNIANVYDPKEKRYFKAKIKSVIESPSNVNYIRRNIMTKGSVIQTDKGVARITSRPGQEGSLNAVLLKK